MNSDAAETHCVSIYEDSRGAQLYRVVYMVRVLMDFQRNRSRRRLKNPLIEQLRDTICGQAIAFHRCDAQILFFVVTQDLMSNHPQRPPYCVACRHAKPQTTTDRSEDTCILRSRI